MEFLGKIKDFFITDFGKRYGDDGKRARSAHSIVRWRKIFQSIIVVGALFFGIAYSQYQARIGAMGTPTGTEIQFEKSKVPLYIDKYYVDKDYGGLTIMFTLNSQALEKLPYEGQNYQVLLVSPQFKNNTKFPIVLSRYSTNGDMQLSIPLSGLKPSVPIDVYIVSKNTLQGAGGVGGSSAIMDSGSNADILKNIQNATKDSNAKTEKEDSGVDIAKFTVVPNNKLQTTKIDQPIFKYKGANAEFNAGALNDVTATSAYLKQQEEDIKNWKADIANQQKTLEEGKRRLLANSQDNTGAKMVASAQATIDNDNKAIATANKNIKVVKDVPSAPWVLSPLVEATTIPKLKK